LYHTRDHKYGQPKKINKNTSKPVFFSYTEPNTNIRNSVKKQAQNHQSTFANISYDTTHFKLEIYTLYSTKNPSKTYSLKTMEKREKTKHAIK